MLLVPQGLTEEQFADLSAQVRAAVAHLGSDVQVHGSRVQGIANPDSDLDLAIRVDPERFGPILQQSFGTPNPGSAKARTKQHALETGKIQAGEAGLRLLRRELGARFGFAVDISVVRIGGLFDQGPFLPYKGPRQESDSDGP